MFLSSQNVFQDLIYAKFDFAAIGEWFTAQYDTVVNSAGVKTVLDTITGYLDQFGPLLVSVLLLALSLVQVFFGKKLLGFQKFLACFAIGYACGVSFLGDQVKTMINVIEPWMTGLAVGLVAALLCTLVYFLAYVLAAGYSTYLILMGGYYLPADITSFTKDNWVVSLCVAAGVVVIALLLRKWIEILGTAFLGGWCAYLSIEALLVATTGNGFSGIEFLASYTTIVMWVIIGIFALLGFAVQIKTRRRY